MTFCLVALGANLPSSTGTPIDTLAVAVTLFADESLTVTAQSRWYQTPAFPAGAGPDFVNGVVRAETDLTPAAILEALHRIEARLGRVREERWGARTCDLDLIAVGDRVLPDAATQDAWRGLSSAEAVGAVPDGLILPHPRLQDRGFVLVPLADVAADWRHPRTGETARQMLAALLAADRDAVRPIG